MHMDRDKPLLTRADVRVWQTRMEELLSAEQTIQQEKAELIRKLEAARVFMGDSADPSEAEEPSQMSMAEPMAQPLPSTSITELVPLAVKSLGGAPNPSQIKSWILAHSSSPSVRESVIKPYFYTVLMRHAQSGRLIKEGTGYRLPSGSSKGETGVGDPGSKLTPKQVWMPLEAARKAGGT